MAAGGGRGGGAGVEGVYLVYFKGMPGLLPRRIQKIIGGGAQNYLAG